MKALRVMIVMVTLYCIQSSSYAGESIQGAFGFTLGEEFNLAKAIKTISTYCDFPISDNTGRSSLVDVYQVAVSNGLKVFSTYYVEITPKSRKIYRITATGNDLKPVEREELIRVLRDKYDSRKVGNGISHKVIDQGNRYVSLSSERHESRYINVSDSYTSKITYTDLELLALAEREKAQMAINKNSGL